MDMPLGYSKLPSPKSVPNRLICKLHKSLYGLKQASRQWYSRFSQSLLTFGFTQSKSDYTLFTKGIDSSFIALLVYVDDIIIAGPSHFVIDSLKTFLKAQFKLKDLRCLKYFLGLEIFRSKAGISLCQRQYALQLLEDTDFLAGKPTHTPMDPTNTLSTAAGDLLADNSIYRRLIGRLSFLTISRPDITYVVHKLNQFVAQPRFPHLQAVHHLLRYLKSSPGQGIYFSASSLLQIKAFSDAD